MRPKLNLSKYAAMKGNTQLAARSIRHDVMVVCGEDGDCDCDLKNCVLAEPCGGLLLGNKRVTLISEMGRLAYFHCTPQSLTPLVCWRASNDVGNKETHLFPSS